MIRDNETIDRAHVTPVAFARSGRAPPARMRRHWRLVAVQALALVVAAGCGGSGYQLWVVNERPDPVVIVVQVVGAGLMPDPNQPPRHYTVPGRSEACTYCGSGSFPRARILIYTAAGCEQLGAAVLIGANSYIVTVPRSGLVELDHGGRADPSRGPQLQPAQTECG